MPERHVAPPDMKLEAVWASVESFKDRNRPLAPLTVGFSLGRRLQSGEDCALT